MLQLFDARASVPPAYWHCHRDVVPIPGTNSFQTFCSCGAGSGGPPGPCQLNGTLSDSLQYNYPWGPDGLWLALDNAGTFTATSCWGTAGPLTGRVRLA